MPLTYAFKTMKLMMIYKCVFYAKIVSEFRVRLGGGFKVFPLRNSQTLAARLGSLKFVSSPYTSNFQMDVETRLSETQLT